MREADLADGGAYSCEAINSQGREFVGADTLVTIEDTDEPRVQEEEMPSRCDGGEDTTTPGRCGEPETTTGT